MRHVPSPVLPLVVLLAVSCASPPADLHRDAARVAERWTSQAIDENIDSLAVWPPQGWVIATAKDTDQLLVFAAADGKLLRRVGEPGIGIGQLTRPNGIAVIDDWLLVVERDTHRVQVFALPDFRPAAIVGAAELRYPYGLAVFSAADGYELYVTDDYKTVDGKIPPEADLGERVKRFRITVRDGALAATLVRSFGATSGDGALHKVESVAVDPPRGRLLLADEEERDFKVYSLEGEFTGRVMGRGLFGGEPEGIALFTDDGRDYWLVADQYRKRTVFLLFDADSLQTIGKFEGSSVVRTDGIAVASGVPEAPGGLFAVSDDNSVAAFGWSDIAAALGLSQAAAPP